jgi:hypothetical protein
MPQEQKIRMCSPNEMFAAAKKEMLGGNEPVSIEDWLKIICFWAATIKKEVAVDGTMLMAAMYGCPLKQHAVRKIAKIQVFTATLLER